MQLILSGMTMVWFAALVDTSAAFVIQRRVSGQDTWKTEILRCAQDDNEVRSYPYRVLRDDCAQDNSGALGCHPEAVFAEGSLF